MTRDQATQLTATIDVAVSAEGLLRAFSTYGVLTWADVHPAQHLAHLWDEPDPEVRLAFALAVRALRAGSLCVSLPDVASRGFGDEEGAPEVPEGAWPEPDAWREAVRRSPAVSDGEQITDPPRPFRLVDGLLYLERYWADQEAVRLGLLGRLDRLQVFAGGPGTGKTWNIARLVNDALAADPGMLIALAAPTGKAAARMTESLAARTGATRWTASTLHRLLGWRPGSRSRFRHDSANPLPHDLVIVDEVSMVSMTLMARLLDALKPSARLVLVGDPDQLASVEAGAVLADVVRAPATADRVTHLRHNYRFAGAIARLADAIRTGDAEEALAVLACDDPAVRLVDPAAGEAEARRRCSEWGRALHAAASAGNGPAALAALDTHRLLCAHRAGPFGVQHWTRLVQAWLAEDVPGHRVIGEFWTGRPLMMTWNATDLQLFNGDTGVVVAGPGGSPQAFFATGGGPRAFSPWVLEGLQSVYAMTVHKAQGSQFERVSVVLPPPTSPLLTRELLYTAVTRASAGVLLVGTPDAVRQAIGRPALRSSGLADRLRAL